MRIVHLTDLHLRCHLPGTSSIKTRRSRAMLAALARVAPRISALEPDLLALTGDLLDYPLEHAADPRFRSLALADLAALREALKPLACTQIVLPGNHDVDELCAQVFPPMRECVVAGYRVFAFGDREGPGHVPLRCGQERARLEAALRQDDSLPQVHLQHYVVWPRLNEGYPHTYADAEALRQQIAASGRVRLVLSGHYHRGVAPTCAQGVWFAVTPAFCEAPHPYRIYDLADGELAWREQALEEERPWAS